jgi:TusA-related sulfurtransferase
MFEIDVRGLTCPLPLIAVKEAIENGEKEILVRVDTAGARDNIIQLALEKEFSCSLEEKQAEFEIVLRRGEE